MPEFRRGAAAIKKAQEDAKSGNFKPFTPTIKWADEDAKYVMFLTPLEETPLVNVHEFIPIGEWESKDKKKQGTRYGFYVSRKDPAIGEDFDQLEDEFGMRPAQRNIAVAVELDPITEKKGGRNRVTGFEVKTMEFSRKNEDDETEEVTAPVIGVVSQSPSNFYGFLTSYNERHAPIEEVVFEVTCDGNDKDTDYHFVPFTDADVDLTPVLENLEGITYLEDQLEDLEEAIEDLEDREAVLAIAEALLDARLEELADGDRYDKEVSPLKVIKQPWGKFTRGGGDDEDEEKPKRRSRRSRSQAKEEPEAEAESTESESEEEPAEEPKADDKKTERRRRFDRAKAEAKKKSGAAA